MKKFIFCFLTIGIMISCSSEKIQDSGNCNVVTGEFNQLIIGNRRTYSTRYSFDEDKVSMLSMSKVGSGEFKKDGRSEGTFRIVNDEVIMNFGGSDVKLNITKDSKGCIRFLSNEFGQYERDKSN